MAGPYLCKCCSLHFAKKSTYIQHLLKKQCGKPAKKTPSLRKTFPCQKCSAVFCSRYNLSRHVKRFHSSSSIILYSCGVCSSAFATIPELQAHRQTSHVYHHEFESVASAHKRKIELLRLFFPQNFTTLDEGLIYSFPRLVQLMETLLAEKSYFKTNLNCSVEMVKYGEEGQIVTSEVFNFPCPSLTLSRDADPTTWRRDLSLCLEHVQSSVYEFLHRGSGWSVLGPRFLEVEVAECKTLAGSFSCALHTVCFNKRVPPTGSERDYSVNSFGEGSEEEEGACFYYAVANSLLPKELHNDIPRLKTFIQKRLRLLPKTKRFDVRVSDIEEFEELNKELHLAINVVSYDEKNNLIPVRVRKMNKVEDRNRVIVPLLLHKYAQTDPASASSSSSSDLAWHYAHIPDPISLFNKRRRDEEGRVVTTVRKFICWNCLTLHGLESAYHNHISYCHVNECRVLKMPKVGAVESFKNRLRSKRVVFNSAYMLFYDFETLQTAPDADCSCPPDVVRLPLDAKAQEKERERILDDLIEDEQDYRVWEREKEASGRKRFRAFKFKNRRPRRVCPHKTKLLAKQPAFCYSTILVDREGVVRARNTYTGMDAAEHFVNYVICLADEYMPKLSPGRPMPDMTEEQMSNIRMAEDTCWICEEEMSEEDRVIDHDHVSGKILGVAHSVCNLQRKEVPQLTCFAHNFSGYDSHLILSALHKSPLTTSVTGVPQNTQKFKCVTVNKRIKFVDSLQFLAGSLASLTNVLQEQNHHWPLVKQVVKDPAQLAAIDAKAPYPYNFATSIEALAEKTELPAMEWFDNDLADEPCDAKKYEKAKHIWEVFECKNMVEFTQVYVSLDVLLLAEVVQNFKNDMFDAFQVDICQYLSVPHVAMDVMLKYTEAEFELVTDPEMADLLRKNIRGGLSFAAKRYSDPRRETDNQPPSNHSQRWAKLNGCNVGGGGGCLLYIDLNNLYGWSMMEPLPVDGFRWMTDSELRKFDFDNMPPDVDGGPGFFFEVDLSYPECLHVKHNYMPLAPHNMEVRYDDLSDYQKECYRTLCAQPHNEEWLKTHYKSNKLTATFQPRKNYLVHSRNLALYLKHGLRLDKVHRGITFRQAAVVRPFIEKCTQMRLGSASVSRRNLYKLIANSVYGKFIEDFSKRMDAFFNFSGDSFLRRATSPLYRGSMILEEDLSVSFLNKSKVDMKQVWPVGFTILELSKLKMQEMFYDAIQPAFGWGAVEVVMSDTDSFMLEVRGFTVDEARHRLAHVMDFSNLHEEHPYYSVERALVPGFFKDECPMSEVVKVVALKSKTYAFRTEADKMTAKAKGVKSSVKDRISFDNYEICLRLTNKHYVWQKNLRSFNHVNFKIGEWKKAFDSFDNKRFALCEVHTVPYGSALIKHYHANGGECFYCAYDTLNYFCCREKLGGAVVFLPHLDDRRPYWKKSDNDGGAARALTRWRTVRSNMWLRGCTAGRRSVSAILREVRREVGGADDVTFVHRTGVLGTNRPNKIDAKHAYVGDGLEDDGVVFDTCGEVSTDDDDNE